MPNTPQQEQQFLDALEESIAQSSLSKLVLSKPSGAEEGLVRIVVRQVSIKNQPQLCFVYRYKTRDITKNFALPEGITLINELLGNSFRNANLFTTGEELQISFSKKGKPLLHRSTNRQNSATTHNHDRDKQRYLELDRPFLTALGVTNDQQQLIPAMSRKWKQINKFIELFQYAFDSSTLKEKESIQVLDFGSGKGYLTFALHDFLNNSRHINGQVTGVELRTEMVTLCNNSAAKLHLNGLHFHLGDVRSYTRDTVDVMIALHACDIATDHAIHMGIRSNATIIMCAPCCHKEIRPQVQTPAVLQPLLQYGVHLGQEAEMITDTLRALLLNAHGYDTKVLEFVSLEHTSKNKMILAVKREQSHKNDDTLAQIRSLKAFYGIEKQCLEGLLTSA